jgi:hypothetical protein
MSSFTGAVSLMAAQAGAIRDRLPSNARHSGSRDDRPHVTRRFRSASLRGFCRRAPDMAIGLISAPSVDPSRVQYVYPIAQRRCLWSFFTSGRRTGRRHETTAHIRTPSRPIVTHRSVRDAPVRLRDGARQGRRARSFYPVPSTVCVTPSRRVGPLSRGWHPRRAAWAHSPVRATRCSKRSDSRRDGAHGERGRMSRHGRCSAPPWSTPSARQPMR